jgi:histidine triad (HIT) family protein
MTTDADCVFCGIVAGTIPGEIVHESETTVAFRDLNPVAPTHVLVVPRRHVDSAAAVSPDDAPLLEQMIEAAQAVAAQEGIAAPERGYRLLFNVGPDAQNSVPHLHLHVIGGREMGSPG